MTHFRHIILAIAATLSIGSAPAWAQASSGQGPCLSSDEMRDAVFAGYAIPAGAATRAARDAHEGDVVRVRLCHQEQRLVYRVTLLQRDGRVGHVTIDGSSGKVAEVR